MKAIISFIKDAKHELSQVTWLSRQQAIAISSITVVFILVSTIFLWGVDNIFTKGYKSLKTPIETSNIK